MGGTRGDVKWRASDVEEAKEALENELWRRWSDGKFGEWAQCIDCCLIYVVMCATHVSSPVTIRFRNSSPSSWYRCRNVNADSMLFPLFSGISCYALCIQNVITDHTSQLAGARIWASNFNRCNDATVRTRELPLVHASWDVITLSRTCSRFMQSMV